MTYPIGARVKYRDQLDGPVGRITGHHWAEVTEQYVYEIQWTDYRNPMAQSARFVETELEVY